MQLRNEAGPVSHGKDGFVVGSRRTHRRAAVLSADAIVTYLARGLSREPTLISTQTREPYERFETFNDLIDGAVSLEAETDEDGDLS